MPNDKQAMLNTIKKEWLALVSLLDKVPASKMETPILPGNWSAKDVMGHMTTWEEIVAENLKTLLAGRDYVRPYSDYNVYNDQEIARKRKLSLAEVKRRFEQSNRDLLTLLEGLPDDYFKPGSKTATLIGNETFDHYAEHAKDM